MRISSVNSLFVTSNILPKLNAIKNVNFTGDESDRCRLALEIYEIREMLEQMKSEYASIQEVAHKGLPFNVDKAAKLESDIIESTKKFNELDKKYKSYKPVSYDFMDDVNKGRTLRLIERDSTDDDGSATLSEVMGTSTGDFPFFCP